MSIIWSERLNQHMKTWNGMYHAFTFTVMLWLAGCIIYVSACTMHSLPSWFAGSGSLYHLFTSVVVCWFWQPPVPCIHFWGGMLALAAYTMHSVMQWFAGSGNLYHAFISVMVCWFWQPVPYPNFCCSVLVLVACTMHSLLLCFAGSDSLYETFTSGFPVCTIHSFLVYCTAISISHAYFLDSKCYSYSFQALIQEGLKECWHFAKNNINKKFWEELMMPTFLQMFQSVWWG
jgi:hypothetical protein